MKTLAELNRYGCNSLHIQIKQHPEAPKSEYELQISRNGINTETVSKIELIELAQFILKSFPV